MPTHRASFVLSLALAAGCSPTPTTPAVDASAPDAELPVPFCPPAPTSEGPYFEERTDAWGLGGIAANAFAVADVDGDGFADLVTFDLARYRRGRAHLFMNHAAGAGRRFADATESSGFFDGEGGVTDRIANLAAFADLENDGDLDAVSAVYYDGSIPMAESDYVLVNDGTGHFAASPLVNEWLPAEPLTSQVLFFDENLDGRVDLLLSHWWESPAFSTPFGNAPRFMEGVGDGTFVDVTTERGITGNRTEAGFFEGTAYRPTFGASACDLDGDGRPELLFAAYGRFWNQHYASLEDGGWEEVGRASGVAGDDDVDYTADQAYRCYCAANAGACPAGVPSPNTAWGCRPFNPGVDDQPAFLNGNTFSISCGDVDNDGDLDLYTSEIHHPDVPSSDRAEILINDGTGNFTRPGRDAMGLVPPIDPLSVDEGGQNGALFDFDGDGWLDVYLGGSPYDQNAGWLFRQDSPGHFAWIGDAGGLHPDCPHGIALADFDHDGDQDLAVGTYGCGHAEDDERVRFFENVSPARSFVSLRLVGTNAARTPLGARVTILAGGVTQTMELAGTWGRGGSARDLVVHAGLGSACTIDHIEVRWPDAAGSTSTFTNVAANLRYEVRQGDEALHRL